MTFRSRRSFGIWSRQWDHCDWDLPFADGPHEIMSIHPMFP